MPTPVADAAAPDPQQLRVQWQDPTQLHSSTVTSVLIHRHHNAVILLDTTTRVVADLRDDRVHPRNYRWNSGFLGHLTGAGVRIGQLNGQRAWETPLADELNEALTLELVVDYVGQDLLRVHAPETDARDPDMLRLLPSVLNLPAGPARDLAVTLIGRGFPGTPTDLHTRRPL